MVGQQVQQQLQQLQQSIVEQVTSQLKESLRLGRSGSGPADSDTGMADNESDDTSLHGPDWSSYLMGSNYPPILLRGKPSATC